MPALISLKHQTSIVTIMLIHTSMHRHWNTDQETTDLYKHAQNTDKETTGLYKYAKTLKYRPRINWFIQGRTDSGIQIKKQQIYTSKYRHWNTDQESTDSYKHVQTLEYRHMQKRKDDDQETTDSYKHVKTLEYKQMQSWRELRGVGGEAWSSDLNISFGTE